MRILVTGGAGFIGSHVAEAALKSGNEVGVIDDLSSGKIDNVPRGARFYETDIRDREAIDRVFGEFKPDVISHHAAQASVSVSVREPILDSEVNINGTINLLEASRVAQTHMFIFASTGGAIYGEVPEGRRAKVDWPARPLSPYACSKYSAEVYLAYYRSQWGLDYRILRYSNVYGPRQDPHGEAGVVAIFCRRLLEGNPIQINARRQAGDEGCIRDYVFVADVVRANQAAWEGKIPQPILNVSTGTETCTRDLAGGIEKALGVRAQVSSAPKRAGDLERSVLDAHEFRRTLRDQMPLERGLESTVTWFREQGKKG